MNKPISKLDIKNRQLDMYTQECFKYYQTAQAKKEAPTEWALAHLIAKHSNQITYNYFVQLLEFVGFYSIKMRRTLINAPFDIRMLEVQDYWSFMALAEYYLDNDNAQNKIDNLHIKGNEWFQACDECTMRFGIKDTAKWRS
ncbi:hypothetical protein ACNQ2K_00205 [Mycoplasma sp. VS292A]|uniref:hypothetical protein n=1 Tax=Mycoplasma sp. VS292A TaxID=3401680 RepID=UPI003AAE6101